VSRLLSIIDGTTEAKAVERATAAAARLIMSLSNRSDSSFAPQELELSLGSRVRPYLSPR
jgi:hypothetical protein